MNILWYDFSLIKVGSACMACDVDRLWHAAVIVDVLEDHEVKVKWDRKDEMDTLPMEKLWPMGEYGHPPHGEALAYG